MITKEISDREGEAACYGSLGVVYESLSECEKAEEYKQLKGTKRFRHACHHQG